MELMESVQTVHPTVSY